MEFTICRREECVQIVPLDLLIANCDSLVTDMLIAILNTCSKEELDEESEEDPEDIDAEEGVDSAERRRVIKNKILAVGKMAKVFAVLRCVTVTFVRIVYLALLTLIYREEAERVSELKNISASNNLPYGTLVLGSEGIKDAIQNFDDAYVTYQSAITFLMILSQTEIRYRERASASRPYRPGGCKGVPFQPGGRRRSTIATNNRITRTLRLVRVVLTKRRAVVSNVAHHSLARPSDAGTAVSRVWVPPQPVQVLAGGVSKTRRVCLETSSRGRSPRGRITSSRRSQIHLLAPYASGLGRSATWPT
jgi:hypothetical protein